MLHLLLEKNILYLSTIANIHCFFLRSDIFVGAWFLCDKYVQEWCWATNLLVTQNQEQQSHFTGLNTSAHLIPFSNIISFQACFYSNIVGCRVLEVETLPTTQSALYCNFIPSQSTVQANTELYAVTYLLVDTTWSKNTLKMCSRNYFCRFLKSHVYG